MPKAYSYQQHAPTVVVKIYGKVVLRAVSRLGAVDDITHGIDYPNLTEFRIGEASFSLIDPNGDYSPNNTNNFFVQQAAQLTPPVTQTPDGAGAPIEIEAGFIVDGTAQTETIFTGNILKVFQDSEGSVKVTCVDKSGILRANHITDFGIDRHFMLRVDPTQPGVYPVLRAALPPSNASIEITTRTGGMPIQQVDELATEGQLSPLNFIVTDDGIQTEGGSIHNRGIGFPQIRMKSPYRQRPITDIIRDLLTDAGITLSDIQLPQRVVGQHFSSNGRVGYDLIGKTDIGSSNSISWNGYVTDIIKDGDDRYFLYNKGEGNINGISQIIHYDKSTETETRLHQFNNNPQVWKFVKQGNSFYVVATSNEQYDANIATCETHILYVDTDASTETVYVPHTNTLRPQLAHYYHGVGNIFMKPDSRRKLIYRDGDGLYYAYVDGQNVTPTYGIAKATAQNTTQVVISVNLDSQNNHGGISFDILNDTLEGLTTFTSGSATETVYFEKAL